MWGGVSRVRSPGGGPRASLRAMSLRRILLVSVLAGLALWWIAERLGLHGTPVGMGAAFVSVVVLGVMTPPKRPKSGA